MSLALAVNLHNSRSMPQLTNDDYEALPECIRQYYSRQEYLWLSDQQKQDLLRAETEPDEE